MTTRPSTIDQYISSFPEATQVLLQEIRAAIQKAAPNAEECIGYGIPTFKLNGNLVHFAGYKNHLGFYPGADGIAAFERELSAYKRAKGSVQFPIDKKMPLALIGRIVKYRVRQNTAKQQTKK
jgi:uncharacterized protein YdhG (YjbR/CyaY superfamily)